jgi:hypothetical protein
MAACRGDKSWALVFTGFQPLLASLFARSHLHLSPTTALRPPTSVLCRPISSPWKFTDNVLQATSNCSLSQLIYMSSTVNLRKTYNNFVVPILFYCITTAIISACCRCHYHCRCLCADTVDVAVCGCGTCFLIWTGLTKKGWQCVCLGRRQLFLPSHCAKTTTLEIERRNRQACA